MDITALLLPPLLNKTTSGAKSAEGDNFAGVMDTLLAQQGSNAPWLPAQDPALPAALDNSLPAPVLAERTVFSGMPAPNSPTGNAPHNKQSAPGDKPPEASSAIIPVDTLVQAPLTPAEAQVAVASPIAPTQGAMQAEPGLPERKDVAASSIAAPVAPVESALRAASPSSQAPLAAPTVPVAADRAAQRQSARVSPELPREQAMSVPTMAGSTAAIANSLETDLPQSGQITSVAVPAAPEPAAPTTPVFAHTVASSNTPIHAAGAEPATGTITTQATLWAPVASQAWQQQLGQQLSIIAQRGRHQVQLHLNPVDLGPLSISMLVDDRGATAQFLSSHAAVRSAVEQAIPHLREALAEQGIALGEASVGEEQRQFGNRAGTDTDRRSSAGDSTAESTVDTIASSGPVAPLTARPGVDVYA